MWTIDRGSEESSEGRARARERDVIESWLEHGPEMVQEADEVGRIAVATIDNGVSAAAPDVIAT